MATKTISVELPLAWWDRVDMALDIAQIRSAAYRSPEVINLYAEAQAEIRRQLKLEAEAHADEKH